MIALRALLDVNVLIALLERAHIGRAAATQWLTREIGHGWASCPITQNGCIRIMSRPAYPGALAAAEMAPRLAEAAGHSAHAFWPDDLSLVSDEVLDWSRGLGHREVTNNYLLVLAVRHGGRFVTFDSRAGGSAVRSAGPQHQVVLRL